MNETIKGRIISKGYAEGEALVSQQPFSFFGGVDTATGIVIEKGHELESKCIAGKILVFPTGKGSTVGSWVIYQLSENGVAPKAIVNIKAEPIIAVGAIISNIPLIDSLEKNPLEAIKTGDYVKVNTNESIIVIEKQRFKT